MSTVREISNYFLDALQMEMMIRGCLRFLVGNNKIMERAEEVKVEGANKNKRPQWEL